MSLDKIIVLVFVAITAIGLLVLRRNSRLEKQEGKRQNPQRSS